MLHSKSEIGQKKMMSIFNYAEPAYLGGKGAMMKTFISIVYHLMTYGAVTPSLQNEIKNK